VAYRQRFLLGGPLGEDLRQASFPPGTNGQPRDVIPARTGSLRVLEVIREEPDGSKLAGVFVVERVLAPSVVLAAQRWVTWCRG
jgi:hypothetical protein